MDIADHVFVTNLDWDPQYLMECVTQDFYDFTMKTEFDDMAIPHTCPAGGVASTTCSFKVPLQDDKLAELSHKNFSPDTKKQIRWVRKMYRE